MTVSHGKSGDPRRAERLKAALRDNLKRRKAQVKARACGASPPPGGGRSTAEDGREGVKEDPHPRRGKRDDPPPAGEGEDGNAR